MPKIDYKELKKNLDVKDFSRIYFLCGEEKYLIDNFEKKIKEKVLGEKYSDFDFKSFDFENLNLENFGEALEMPPIQTKFKCVILRNLNADEVTTEISEGLLKILEDIPEYSVLIISQMPGKGAAKIKKIQNFIEKNGCIVNFSSKDIPIEKQLIAWAKDYGKVLEKGNANLITKRCGEDLATLNAEIKKICGLEENEVISEKTIEKITAQKHTANIFELSKAIMNKDASKAISVLDALLNQKEDPIAILAVIASGYVDVARVSTAILGGSNENIVKDFFDYKKKEFRLKNAATYSRKMKFEQIKNYLKVLLDSDVALKSTSVSPRIILSETVCKLCAM